MDDARDGRFDAPPGLAALLEEGERVLLVLPGFPRSLVATDRRVITGPSSTSPASTRVFRYEELTGVTAHLGILSRRSVVLEGPGLRTDWAGSNHDGNAVTVQVWRLGQARDAVERLRSLIADRTP